MTPHCRDQGSGTGVVCLHSNASSSAQWRLLADALAGRYRVLAVDGYGAGKSPDWPAGAVLRLDDEVDLASAVFDRAGERFHVVGHSYGASVAVKLALRHRARVRSLVLYEPTLFHLVVAGDPLRSPAAGIWRAASDAAEAVARGDNNAAAERFIDFWISDGAWAAMPPPRQAAIAATMPKVGRWRDTLFAEDMTRAELAALDVPVLLMSGENSPASSLAVVRVLQDLLPAVTPAQQPGLGHMGPITNPERVNPLIADFIDEH